MACCCIRKASTGDGHIDPSVAEGSRKSGFSWSANVQMLRFLEIGLENQWQVDLEQVDWAGLGEMKEKIG